MTQPQAGQFVKLRRILQMGCKRLFPSGEPGDLAVYTGHLDQTRFWAATRP